ncbi:MAG: hypothetical protein RM022_027355 [Nostoc sp. EfeVER01]|uniref:hypothetical protein n=1 Tax=Nostoc sp. EfeVER01 TaxID=3075406 RepID=UPI003919A1EB
MSQAVIELLAEYFDINLADNSTKEYTGGLPSRVTQLEQLISDLKQSYIYLSEKVDLMESTSKLPIVKSDNSFTNYQSEPLGSIPESFLFSSPVNLASLPETVAFTSSINLTSFAESSTFSNSVNLSSLPDSETTGNLLSRPVDFLENDLHSKPKIEPLNEENLVQENTFPENSSLLIGQGSRPHNLAPHQLEIVEPGSDNASSSFSSLTGSTSIKVNYSVLALRLGATEGYIRNKTSTSGSPQKFAEWTTKKDPDKIGWEPRKEGKNVHYYPIGDLNNVQKSNLQDWLIKNKDFVD